MDDASDISGYIIDGTLKILVKPGKRENRIIGYDPERGAVIVEIRTQAQENKANLEVIRFFSKILKRKAIIKSGFRSKEKTLSFLG